jgi:hypothetical protein
VNLGPARFSQVERRRYDMDPIGHFMGLLMIGAAALVTLGATGIGVFGLLRRCTA